MATLDANLPDPPDDDAELASGASGTGEPAAEADTAPPPDTKRDVAGRSADPRRARERVAIVQKDRVEDLRA